MVTIATMCYDYIKTQRVVAATARKAVELCHHQIIEVVVPAAADVHVQDEKSIEEAAVMAVAVEVAAGDGTGDKPTGDVTLAVKVAEAAQVPAVERVDDKTRGQAAVVAVAQARSTKSSNVQTTVVRVDSTRVLLSKGATSVCSDGVAKTVVAPLVFVPSPPPTWRGTAASGPATRSVVKSAESRKRSKKTKRSAARARKRERKQHAAAGQGEGWVGSPRQQLLQERSARELATAAAGVIQSAWRRVVKRVRCVRAYTLRIEERRRQVRAVRVIAKAWHLFFASRAASPPMRMRMTVGASEVEATEKARCWQAAITTVTSENEIAHGEAKLHANGQETPGVGEVVRLVQHGWVGSAETTHDQQVLHAAAVPNRGGGETSVEGDDEGVRVGGGGGGASTPKPAPLHTRPSTTSRAEAKLAVERRSKKAANRKAARQRKKELKNEACARQAAARHYAEVSARCRAYKDVASEAAAGWQKRRAEVERNVAAGRALQEMQERARRKAATSIQAVWRNAVARLRCLRLYTLRVVEIERDSADNRVQRQECEREASAAVVVQAAWKRTAVRLRCFRAYVLRVGARRRRTRALRVIAAACHAYVKARRVVADTTMQQHYRREVEESVRPVVPTRDGEEPGPADEANVHMSAKARAVGGRSLRTAWANGVLLRMARRIQKRRSDERAVSLSVEVAAAAGTAAVQKGETKENVAEAKTAREAVESVAVLEGGEEVRNTSATHKEEQKPFENLKAAVATATAERQVAQAAEREDARLAGIRSSLHLPPARQHTTTAAAAATIRSGAPSPPSEPVKSNQNNLVTHPLQLVEGKTMMYDPMEFDLWPILTQLQGWTLTLGTAPVWGGGNQREAEAFSAACGFSAAWGPVVLKLVAISVYGKVFSRGVSVLPTNHVVYAFGKYWEKEIAPYDATERFFRLAKVGSDTNAAANILPGSNGGIRKVCFLFSFTSISSHLCWTPVYTFQCG